MIAKSVFPRTNENESYFTSIECIKYDKPLQKPLGPHSTEAKQHVGFVKRQQGA